MCASPISPPTSEVAQDVPAQRGRHVRNRVSWFEPLFPFAERSRTPTWVICALYPLAFVALTALAVVRQSGVAATNTVWAEDGAIFYQQSRLNGFFHTLTTPYAGYFELGPRVLVQLTRLAPMSEASAVIALTGAGGIALVCCYVFHASRGILPPVWSRMLLAAVIIFLPLATGEILDNDVNIGWWLFFAAFWALLTRPRTRTDAALAGLVCFVATATEPLVALLIPLAIVRVLVMRTDLREEASVIGFLLALLYQGIGIMTAHGTSAWATATAHGAAPALGLRVGWGWLSGNDLSNHILKSSHAPVWEATGYVVLLAIVVGALLLRDRATSFFVVTAVGFAVLTFVVPVIVRGVGPNLVGQPLYVGSRYSATPVMLLWSAVLAEALLLSQALQRPLVRYAPALVCLLLLVPVWALDFRPANLRTSGPRWNQQVSGAVARCRAHPEGTGNVQISPPGWQVVLPCKDIS